MVKRGFPRPPSYLSARHFFDVITNGYGVMYPHADRVPEADRWAITAYIRALQAPDPTIAPDNPARAAVPAGTGDG